MSEVSFETLYDAVFDEDGKQKACGRAACLDLINYVQKNFRVTIGDTRTGFITETSTVKSLYDNYMNARK